MFGVRTSMPAGSHKVAGCHQAIACNDQKRYLYTYLCVAAACEYLVCIYAPMLFIRFTFFLLLISFRFVTFLFLVSLIYYKWVHIKHNKIRRERTNTHTWIFTFNWISLVWWSYFRISFFFARCCMVLFFSSILLLFSTRLLSFYSTLSISIRHTLTRTMNVAVLNFI